MTSKKYKDGSTFRNALLEKLKNWVDNPSQIQNKQRQIAFERFLCRLFHDAAPSWVLKGGHALELRMQNSRATKDLDLALRDNKIFKANTNENQNIAILALLQDKASIDLDDYFTFNILPPTLDLDAPPYGGGRFPVESQLGGKRFIRFHVDVAIGDVWIEPHEDIEIGQELQSMGIETKKIPIISIEQHFAEKIHAYTVPRESGYNSRVKDLVDMILLINEGIDRDLLKISLEKTFTKRKTHEVPIKLIAPPLEWKKPFDQMAIDSKLNISIEDTFKTLNTFWYKIQPW